MFLRAALLIPLLLVLPSYAAATTCVSFARAPEEMAQAFLDGRSAVFLGEVIATEPPISQQRQYIRVRVLHRWKGAESNELTLLYRGSYENFEIEMGRAGTRRMFYAGPGEGGELTAGFCDFQDEASDERLKRMLGPGEKIDSPSPQPTTEETSFFASLWRAIRGIFGS